MKKHDSGELEKITKWLLILVAAVTISQVLTGCERETTVAFLTEVQENEPDQEFIDSRIVITQQGSTNAIVQADSIKVFQSRNITAIDGGMAVDFFDTRGEKSSTLSAGHGEIWGLYESVDSLRAYEQVVVVSADSSKRIDTDSSLTWNAETHTIYADGLVRLTSGTTVEQGVNFVAKDDLSEYSMSGVTGEYQGSLPVSK